MNTVLFRGRTRPVGSLAVLAVAVLLLAGCNTVPERIVADEGLAPGTRIGVLPINFLQKPSARVYNNALKFAGTAGRLAVAKADDTTRRKLAEGLEDQERYRYQEDYTELLLASLRAAGFQAELLAFDRTIDNVLGAVPPRDFEERYPTPAGYDVLLDVYVDYVGYAAANLTEPYLPTAHIAARIVDAETHTVRYQSRVQYHPIGDGEGVVGVPADASFAYDSVDEVLADIPRVKVGIRTAGNAVVAALVEDISR